jgi:hypothetical protein
MNDFKISDLVPSSASQTSSSAPQEEQKVYEKDVFDRENKHSLINLLSPALQRDIEDMFNKWPESARLYFEGNETDISKDVNPTLITHRLRYALWIEYQKALESGTKIEITRIYCAVCTKQSFYHTMKTKQLFWILFPPTEIKSVMTTALHRGIEKLHALLELDCYDPATKKMNTALASLQLKIIAMLDIRLNGAPTQRIENTNKNLSVQANIGEDQFKQMYDKLLSEQREASKIVNSPSIDEYIEVQDEHISIKAK